MATINNLRDALMPQKHALPSLKRPHNNRKRTKGRKQATHLNGGFKGYQSNEQIRLKKWLRDERRALAIFDNKPGEYQINNMEKKFHMESRIAELEQKLGYEEGQEIKW